jgi:hypothetical protein
VVGLMLASAGLSVRASESDRSHWTAMVSLQIPWVRVWCHSSVRAWVGVWCHSSVRAWVGAWVRASWATASETGRNSSRQQGTHRASNHLLV